MVLDRSPTLASDREAKAAVRVTAVEYAAFPHRPLVSRRISSMPAGYLLDPRPPRSGGSQDLRHGNLTQILRYV